MKKTTKTLIIFSVILFVFAICGINYSSAQTAPEFIISWKAKTFTPADFQGKIYPSLNSQIEIGVNLISNNKIVDLSQYNIAWKINNKTFKSGIGLQNITYQNTLAGGNNLNVQTTIYNYKGADIENFSLIPIKNPQTIIDFRYPNKSNIKTTLNTLQALPYFFNVNSLNELNFNWLINNQAPQNQADRKDILSLNLQTQGSPLETNVLIKATTNKISNELETATGLINPVTK